jgi:hypothetical protein
MWNCGHRLLQMEHLRTHEIVSTWRQRTYLFVYPKSFTNGISSALANWRAQANYLHAHISLHVHVWSMDVCARVQAVFAAGRAEERRGAAGRYRLRLGVLDVD